MISVSEGFKTAIKSNVIKARAKAVFNYSTPLTITQDKIIGINVTQRGEKALGCLQDDKITLEIKTDSMTEEQYGQDVTVKIYLGCVVVDADEYVCIGSFKSTQWKKTDYIISVELGINVPDEQIGEVLAKDNIGLKSYIASSVAALTGKTLTPGSVTDGTLPLAYLYYKTVKEQLKSFAFACQGIFRSGENGLELVPYKFGTSVCTYKEATGEMILDKSGNSLDLVTQKTNYGLARSNFTKEEDANLFSATNFFATDEYQKLDFNFSSPGLVSYLNFKKYSYFNNLKYGLFGGSIRIGGGYEGQTSKVDFSIIGTRIISSVIGKTDDAKSYLSNPYIQTSAQVENLSLDIYNGTKYSIKSRIDPSIQVGDTINIANVGDMLVTCLNYKFDGSLTGTIEGVLKP